MQNLLAQCFTYLNISDDMEGDDGEGTGAGWHLRGRKSGVCIGIASPHIDRFPRGRNQRGSWLTLSPRAKLTTRRQNPKSHCPFFSPFCDLESMESPFLFPWRDTRFCLQAADYLASPGVEIQRGFVFGTHSLRLDRQDGCSPWEGPDPI